MHSTPMFFLYCSKPVNKNKYKDGPSNMNITKIAIAAGCGDKVYAMEEAEKMGAQAYLTGSHR